MPRSSPSAPSSPWRRSLFVIAAAPHRVGVRSRAVDVRPPRCPSRWDLARPTKWTKWSTSRRWIIVVRRGGLRPGARRGSRAARPLRGPRDRRRLGAGRRPAPRGSGRCCGRCPRPSHGRRRQSGAGEAMPRASSSGVRRGPSMHRARRGRSITGWRSWMRAMSPRAAAVRTVKVKVRSSPSPRVSQSPANARGALVRGIYEVGLLGVLPRLPLEVAVRGDQAAALRERRAERWLLGDGLRSGVEHLGADRGVLGPCGDQAPARRDQASAPRRGGVLPHGREGHDRRELHGPDVPRRRQQAGVVRRLRDGEIVEEILLVKEVGVSAAHGVRVPRRCDGGETPGRGSRASATVALATLPLVLSLTFRDEEVPWGICDRLCLGGIRPCYAIVTAQPLRGHGM